MNANKLTRFGTVVAKTLIDRSMTRAQLAKQIDASPQYLSYILYGVRSGEKYIPRIIKVLELDLGKIDKTVA